MYSEDIYRAEMFGVVLAPTQPPQQVNVTEISAYHAVLEWSPPEERHRNGRIQHYMITVDNNKNGQIISTQSQQGYLNLTSLKPHYNYTVSVAAVTVDIGPYANHTFQTNESGNEYN